MSNIEVIGPGLWMALLIVNSFKTGPILEGYIALVHRLLGCNECQTHFSKLIENDRNFDIHWTWRAHNAVNKRIGKPIYSIQHSENVQVTSRIWPGLWLFMNTFACYAVEPRGQNDFIIFTTELRKRLDYRDGAIMDNVQYVYNLETWNEPDFFNWVQEFYNARRVSLGMQPYYENRSQYIIHRDNYSQLQYKGKGWFADRISRGITYF